MYCVHTIYYTILYVYYILYILCYLRNSFWKEQRNLVPQGAGEFATQRDPLQDRGSIPKHGLDLMWQWGSGMWLTLLKVTSPFSLRFYWTPHHRKLGLQSALLSFRPSPQRRARCAGPSLAGFLAAPLATSAWSPLSALLKTWHGSSWLSLPQSWQETRPSPSLCCLPSLCDSSK